jgi:putative nucleotidyltransferase with HDIG domain
MGAVMNFDAAYKARRRPGQPGSTDALTGLIPSVTDQKDENPRLFLIILLMVFSTVVWMALLAPLAGGFSESPLRLGVVAPYDIRAPSPLTFESEVLTNKQRESAASFISPVYSPPDISIARQQLERLRSALVYISSVRQDSFANTDQKLTDLAAMEDLQLSRDVALQILNLSEARWQSVFSESISVLEQIMRTTIREDRFEDAVQRVPSLVSLTLAEDQATIVVGLVDGFVLPNSLYNEALTEATRQQARNSVTPVTRSLVSGQTIVQRGQIIDETQLEALQKYGLTQPTSRWQDVVSASLLALANSAFFAYYLLRFPQLLKGSNGLRRLVICASLFVIFLLVARLTIPGHTVLPYVFPLMAYALIISALFGSKLAIVSTWPLAILTAYNLPFSADLITFYALSSLFGILVLQRAQRVTTFFYAGAAIGVSGAAIATAYRILEPTADWVGMATLAGAAVANGIASASVALLAHYLLAQFLGLPTGLQLTELSRPDHPLLQYILRNSPGTYQHSLQLANLVEHAAERIGADAQLARVGALYHDAGKALNPYFFIENQATANINPHDDIDPVYSAQTIIRHVKDGVELARKFHLPPRIQDFILEHHGTLITRYQYARAVQAAGGNASQVDEEAFRYPGPRPQSRETALLMLADGSYAPNTKDENELRILIMSIVEERRELSQLDDTSLTLKDLNVIIDSFTATLRGVYHPRIQYPKLESDEGKKESGDKK